MTRAMFWRRIAIWYLIDFVVIGGTAYVIITHPPESSTKVIQGAFRCDHSWRLPCDEAR